MSGRRVCETCGATYHLLYNKPEEEGKCSKCGGALIQRKDDHPDTVKNACMSTTNRPNPSRDYYEKQGKLRIVEGQEEVADTTKLTLAALEA